MPTLIRLIVALLFLAGLGYAGLFALSAMVDPGEKEITVRIPARDLVPAPRQLPRVNTTTQPEVASEPQPAETVQGGAGTPAETDQPQ